MHKFFSTFFLLLTVFCLGESKLFGLKELEGFDRAIGRQLTSFISHRIGNRVLHQGNPRIPLLPLLPGYPFPDNLCYKPTSINLQHEDDLVQIILDVVFRTDMTSTGLDSLVDDLTFKVMPTGNHSDGIVVVFWKLDLPKVELMGDYDLNLHVFTKQDETHNYTTVHVNSSNANFVMNDLSLSIFAEAKAFPLYEKLRLNQLKAAFVPPSVQWPADWFIEEIIDGSSTIHFEDNLDFGGAVQTILQLLWDLVLDKLISQDLHCAINYLVSDCSVSQLVNEEFECLRADFENSQCFASLNQGSLSWSGLDLEPCSTSTETEPPETTTETDSTTTTPTTTTPTTTTPKTTTSTTTTPVTTNPVTTTPVTTTPPTTVETTTQSSAHIAVTSVIIICWSYLCTYLM